MRLLGIDYGEKRIGLALSDPMGWTAQAHSVVKRTSLREDLAAITRVIGENEVTGIVMGLPRNMNGSYGPAAEKVRKFSARLQEVTGLPVELWDERLTTVSAQRALLESDLSRGRRKEVVDKVAAALILDGYLRHLGRER